ncbi:hypothetical protein H7I77_25170 [Mycolicibacterium novocastrense]|uniref:Pyridine nucleotide-disulfide oxidoreductase domain protein n=1 Tax=Mycolicibacterium novocastrense TaxID=59813 RepID=A0AAW5SR21_MYCNV|nr:MULTISPECIES: hypothetical protein [Mycolicibacterium]MCV7026603.1 hypothetical protein [Mycolicibacterium novocastrense]MDX1887475.1 hypothetical protein [Mycolicibacterium sp. 120270]GAT07646.1 pyridine nucleotide-disulfide oxidoreductase domain protein [Mycolicibacterium novocastrense]
MNQAQDLLMSILNLGLMAAGVFCMLKGGFAVHAANNGNDDINISGWKRITSWWALGAIMLIPGAWNQFGSLIMNVWQSLF